MQIFAVVTRTLAEGRAESWRHGYSGHRSVCSCFHLRRTAWWSWAGVWSACASRTYTAWGKKHSVSVGELLTLAETLALGER